MSGTDEQNAARKTAPIKNLSVVTGFVMRYKVMVAGAIVALIVAAVANLAIINTLQPMIDKGFGADDPAQVDRYFYVMFAIIAVLAVATAMRSYLVTLLGERVVADLRRAALESVIDLHPSFFEENRPSEIASRLTADSGVIQQVVSVSVSIALRNGALFVGGLIMMVVYNAKLMAIITLALPFIIGPIFYLGRKVRRLSRHSQDRIADMAMMATESLGAIQVVQANTREEEEKQRFTDAVERAYGTAQKRVKARSLLTGVVIFLIACAITFVLWRGAKEVALGHMTGGEMAAFVGFAIISAGAAGAVIEVYGDLQRAAGAATRLGELLRAKTMIKVPADPLSLPHPAKGEVRFETVSFSYPSKPDIAALESFSLSIRSGERIALVGPSGAGKSTVLQMLLRFFDPHEGRVLMDDIDIAKVDPLQLRSRLAVVPQETIIFAASVSENIRYGRPEATDAEVEAAARAAMAHDFIMELSDGYDTWLGERGVRLSGGQRQRLAIARAILRDAPVLLLDEATSALDAESEWAVQEALDHLMNGRTTIVIAHRLATVLKADRIVVLDKGQVVASGRHEELLEKSPLYARLARLQFSAAS